MKIEIEEKYENLFETLFNILSSNLVIRIADIKKEVLANQPVDEEVFEEIIYYLLSKSYLEVAEGNKNFEKIKVKLIKKPEITLIANQDKQEYPKIIVSLPPYNIFGLETELRKQNIPIVTLKEEFGKLFEKARTSIYICSPFLEYSGLDPFLSTLLFKAKEGVTIKVISRQINYRDPNSRYDQIERIQRIFYEHQAQIYIRNYHFLKNDKVVSSTHAKMIVCDYKYAYIGSGEIRKGSFDRNFEIGVILDGEKAYQLGKIFDMLFSVSSDLIKGGN